MVVDELVPTGFSLALRAWDSTSQVILESLLVRQPFRSEHRQAWWGLDWSRWELGPLKDRFWDLGDHQALATLQWAKNWDRRTVGPWKGQDAPWGPHPRAHSFWWCFSSQFTRTGHHFWPWFPGADTISFPSPLEAWVWALQQPWGSLLTDS